MMSGEASLFLPDGDKYYKGEFKNNERNGQGENYWPVANEFHNVPAGTRYIGEWLNDKQHGYGKAIFADGTIKEGKWENGEFIG
jgi:hypothetical protein